MDDERRVSHAAEQSDAVALSGVDGAF